MRLKELIKVLEQYSPDCEVVRDDRFTNGVLVLQKDGQFTGMLDCTITTEQLKECENKYPKVFC